MPHVLEMVDVLPPNEAPEGESHPEPVYEMGSDKPVDEIEHPAIREKATDSWFRELNDGRVEIMCRAPGFRIRVTAPEQEAWEAVELFEKWTGLKIASERRPRRRVAPPAGQMVMIERESESSAETEENRAEG